MAFVHKADSIEGDCGYKVCDQCFHLMLAAHAVI
jgi:hypothetical protein